LVEEGAKLIAEEVVALRAKFKTLLDIHRFFVGNLSWDGNIYRAAITAGLVGDLALARQLFDRIKWLEPAKHGPQLPKIQEDCAELAALLKDPVAYRSAILQTITARRAKRDLPPDPNCLDSLPLPSLSP